MAKDPAFLFYSSDFLTGTMFMSNEQVGKYIRLLCAQHQIGHLSEKDMLNICGTYDKDIFCKFKKDADGLFFNERCEQEILKRKAFSESRRKNRLKKSDHMSNISKTYVRHMENENENENVIKLNKQGVPPKFIEVDGQIVTDPMPMLEFYEAQLNGMTTENQNLAWRPLVASWFNDHQGEAFTDALHAKNSFKRFYYGQKDKQPKPKKLAFKI
jgi:hypothetical protein